MNVESELAAFVLAGGKSTRMGSDKAFLEFKGRTLLSRALDLAGSLTPDVRIVGQPARFAAFAPVVEDVFRDCGPLGAIHAALRDSLTELNLMLAVDMPFVSSELLRYLVERARNGSATVTIPVCAGRRQPLCAVYRRSFAETAELALAQGRFRIDAQFEPRSTLVISEEELREKGFSAEMFRNLNTPEELARAQQ